MQSCWIFVKTYAFPTTVVKNNSFSAKSLVGYLYGGLKPKSNVPILHKHYMDNVLCAICFKKDFSLWSSTSKLVAKILQSII